MSSKKHRRKLKAQHQLRNKPKIIFSTSDHVIDALRRLADATNGIATILKDFYKTKSKKNHENNHQSQNEKTSATSERT